MVNAAALSGTCLGTPSSGGALKSGAHGYAQAGNAPGDIDGEGFAAGACATAAPQAASPNTTSALAIILMDLVTTRSLFIERDTAPSPAIEVYG
jgi:hypothetical protein